MSKRKPVVQQFLPESPDFDLPLPDGFDTPEFVEEWQDFCAHRVEMSSRKRDPVAWTERAAKAILRKLRDYSVEVAAIALRDTVASGKWAGVFPESVRLPSASKQNLRPSIHPSAFEDSQ